MPPTTMQGYELGTDNSEGGAASWAPGASDEYRPTNAKGWGLRNLLSAPVRYSMAWPIGTEITGTGTHCKESLGKVLP